VCEFRTEYSARILSAYGGLVSVAYLLCYHSSQVLEGSRIIECLRFPLSEQLTGAYFYFQNEERLLGIS